MKLVHDARFTDPGFAHNQHDLAFALARPLPAVPQRPHLILAPDEPSQSSRRRALEPGARRPKANDFIKVDRVFNEAVIELRNAGAEVIDPIEIPDLVSLLATRAKDAEADDAMFDLFFSEGNAPFATRKQATASPLFAQVIKGSQARWKADAPERHHAYMKARDILMTNMLKVIADHRLDAIVHKGVEHQPTLIEQGIKPPFADQKGAWHINTFLVFVPSIVVPAGFTQDNLPVGITFLGRPFDDAKMLDLAFSYEQATRHRRPPTTTP